MRQLKVLENTLNRKKLERLEDLARHPDVAQFPVKITRYQAELSKKAPELRKVFLPSEHEIGNLGETDNNYGESENRVLGFKGGQHKYSPTLLLTVWDNCVQNCRYCFRRYTARQDRQITDPEEYHAVFEYIRSHPEINNVLLSGGDPLAMPRKRLEELLEGLSKIESLDFIRIGSKVLVDNPDMINEQLLELLGRYSTMDRRLYIVNQFNHPVELTDKVKDKARALSERSVVLKNQHPILRGVNDSESVIEPLYNGLATIGVEPYYAFHLMPVKGTTHLQTAIDETYFMLERAKENMSGPAKTFRYILPTNKGKAEVLGFDNEQNPTQIYLKFHETKDLKLNRGIIILPYEKGTRWINLYENAGLPAT